MSTVYTGTIKSVQMSSDGHYILSYASKGSKKANTSFAIEEVDLKAFRAVAGLTFMRSLLGQSLHSRLKNREIEVTLDHGMAKTITVKAKGNKPAFTFNTTPYVPA